MSDHEPQFKATCSCGWEDEWRWSKFASENSWRAHTFDHRLTIKEGYFT